MGISTESSADAFLFLFRQVVEQIAPAMVIANREGTIIRFHLFLVIRRRRRWGKTLAC